VTHSLLGHILALNAGSSSIKFALLGVSEADTLHRIVEGEVDAVGSSPHFTARDSAGAVLAQESWTDLQLAFDDLMKKVIAWIEDRFGGDRLLGVGHRVVHGGSRHVQPELVTAEVLAELGALAPLAPLHEPHNLAPIRAIAAARPTLPQVACFDTAFHRTMPVVATRFALPREFEASGVRRYGFHGLSYESIAGRLREVAPELARGAVIVAHLGNGASLCAMRDCRSVDTTMGFTALDGLVMGTRCGSLDPGVILYLEQERGLTAEQTRELLYHRSGLLGVSGGLASDMRTLLASDDPRAREAIELFVYRAAREISALTGSLGGLDGLVFTAGIGEHAPEIRARICARLAWLGVQLDAGANAGNSAVISASASRVEVRVIPTDEEAMIARHALEVIEAGK
jgi:acetate kinase